MIPLTLKTVSPLPGNPQLGLDGDVLAMAREVMEFEIGRLRDEGRRLREHLESATAVVPDSDPYWDRFRLADGSLPKSPPGHW